VRRPFADLIAETLVPYRRASAPSVSPARTRCLTIGGGGGPRLDEHGVHDPPPLLRPRVEEADVQVVLVPALVLDDPLLARAAEDVVQPAPVLPLRDGVGVEDGDERAVTKIRSTSVSVTRARTSAQCGPGRRPSCGRRGTCRPRPLVVEADVGVAARLVGLVPVEPASPGVAEIADHQAGRAGVACLDRLDRGHDGGDRLVRRQASSGSRTVQKARSGRGPVSAAGRRRGCDRERARAAGALRNEEEGLRVRRRSLDRGQVGKGCLGDRHRSSTATTPSTADPSSTGRRLLDRATSSRAGRSTAGAGGASARRRPAEPRQRSRGHGEREQGAQPPPGRRSSRSHLCRPA